MNLCLHMLGKSRVFKIKKSTRNYRRTPRGRGKEINKNALNAGAVKTPRGVAIIAIVP